LLTYPASATDAEASLNASSLHDQREFSARSAASCNG
jgi:hypothetical protein